MLTFKYNTYKVVSKLWQNPQPIGLTAERMQTHEAVSNKATAFFVYYIPVYGFYGIYKEAFGLASLPVFAGLSTLYVPFFILTGKKRTSNKYFLEHREFVMNKSISISTPDSPKIKYEVI